MNSPGRDPRELRKDISDKTAKFLMKGVEQNPAQRFQNPAQFRAAIQELEEE